MWNIQNQMVETLADMNANANFRSYLQMMSVRPNFGEARPTYGTACHNIAKDHGISDTTHSTSALAITGHGDLGHPEDGLYWGQDLPMKQPPMEAPHLRPPDMAKYRNQSMDHGNQYSAHPFPPSVPPPLLQAGRTCILDIHHTWPTL